MRGIEQIVILLRYDSRRNAENRGLQRSDPVASDRSQRFRRGIPAPVSWQLCRTEFFDAYLIRNVGRESQQISGNFLGVHVNEELLGRQRECCRGINDRRSFWIPAPSRQASPL